MPLDLLQMCLANPLVLVTPSGSDPFILHTDASVVGAVAVLTQVIEDDGFVMVFASSYFLIPTPTES